MEARALAGFRGHPDSSLVLLNDALAGRQTDAEALVLFSRVEAPEWGEYVLVVFGVNPDTVVGDRDLPTVSLTGRINADDGWLFAAELERIRDQILQQLA